jgi:hypothetical protein
MDCREPALEDARPADCGASEAAPKQRWSRKAYNEYQREYMRRKRSGFIGIAYG